MAQTVLPEYALTTLVLCASVAVGVAVGTSAVTVCSNAMMVALAVGGGPSGVAALSVATAVLRSESCVANALGVAVSVAVAVSVGVGVTVGMGVRVAVGVGVAV